MTVHLCTALISEPVLEEVVGMPARIIVTEQPGSSDWQAPRVTAHHHFLGSPSWACRASPSATELRWLPCTSIQSLGAWVALSRGVTE